MLLGKVPKSEQIHYINLVLEYYRESLKHNSISDLRFTDNDLISQKYRKIQNPSYFYFNAKNPDALSLIVKHCATANKEYWNKFLRDEESETEPEPENIFKFFYTPLLIPFPDAPNSEPKYFTPFYVEILDQSSINNIFDNRKKRFTDGLKKLVVACNGLNKAKEDKDIDIFGYSALEINTALFKKPFDILDQDFLQKFTEKRNKKGVSFYIETHRHFKDIMEDFFNALGDEYTNLSSIQKIKLFVDYLEENRKMVRSRTFSTVISNDNIKIGHFIFVVNMIEVAESDKFNFGVLKLYDQILNDRNINDGNLIYRYFIGSQLAKSVIDLSDEEIRQEKSKRNKYLNISLKDRVKLSKKQLGAFNAKYALTSSQRYCLQVAKTDLDVIPVNGPPGTGKTSLLRAFVADYMIENAMNVISQYERYCNDDRPFSNIEFFPPIAAFSTNNQAQKNIIEGIVEGFSELKEEGEFFTRWLEPCVGFRENLTVNDFNLYTPLLKTTFDKKNNSYITTENLENIRGDIIARLQDHTKIFLEKARRNFNIDIDLEFGNKRRLLERTFISIRRSVDTVIKNLDNLLSINIDKKITAFEENLQLLEKLADLTHDSDLKIEARKFIKTTREMTVTIDILKNKIEKISEYVEKYSKLNNNNSSKIQQEIRQIKDKAQQDIDDSILKLQTEQNEKIDALRSKQKVGLNTISALSYNKVEFESELELINNKMKKLLYKISDIFSGKYKKEADEIYKKIKHIEKEIESKKSEIALLDKKIEEIKAEYESKSKDIEDKIKQRSANDILNAKKKHKLLFQQEKEKIFDKLKDIGIDSIDDAKKCIEVFNNLQDDYIGTDNILAEIEEINKNLDKERTKLFFTSMHLLEAALLLKFYDNEYDRSEPLCPNCKEKGLKILDNVVKHEKCGFKMRPVVKLENGKTRKATRTELLKILNGSSFFYDYCYYKLQKNGEWYNITRREFAQMDSNTLKNINDLSPIFPLLNTTAQSFFSVFSYWNSENQKRVLPEAYFKYLFVDEAGMVLPSLMVNLYAGQKVLLFGDTKQIEPVYPFAGNNVINTIIMDKITDGNHEPRDLLLDEYSLLKENAMSIANKAIYIDDEHAIRASSEAPLWLLQHFRCANPIIEYCNKLVYNGKIEPMKGEKENYCHLCFIDHNENMNLSKNTCKKEAEIIIDEITKYIEEGYDIKDIGIITPFRNQVHLIEKELQKHDIDTNILYVGTVHKFQGSERKIILFSTASGKNYKGDSKNLFMNRDNGNMLNVAVSRAKERFVLIGCSSAIANNDSSYSGILVKHIEKYERSKP